MNMALEQELVRIARSSTANTLRMRYNCTVFLSEGTMKNHANERVLKKVIRTKLQLYGRNENLLVEIRAERAWLDHSSIMNFSHSTIFYIPWCPTFRWTPSSNVLLIVYQ